MDKCQFVPDGQQLRIIMPAAALADLLNAVDRNNTGHFISHISGWSLLRRRKDCAASGHGVRQEHDEPQAVKSHATNQNASGDRFGNLATALFRRLDRRQR